MNDPHVVKLKYGIVKTDGLEFDDPPDLEIDTPEFHGSLSKGLLILEPKQHFESEDQVRPLADKFIHAWEVTAGLQYDQPYFRFAYTGSVVIDRQPPDNTKSIRLGGQSNCTGDLSMTAISKIYPSPPSQFQVTPEVDFFWNRYCRFLEDREPLLAMAYSCLTFLEGDKSRKTAAKLHSIHKDVLDKLGYLTANRGDNITARKFKPPPTPLSSKEQTWIESAIKAIIKHLATPRPGQHLNMTDLPPLT